MSEKERVVFLKGKRVELRPLIEEDIERFFRWINDPDVRQYVNNYLPMMLEDEREWYESARKSKPNNVLLTIVVDGEPIGTIGLHNISSVDRTAATGTVIGEKEYWGKGYGTEAKMLLLNYAFNTHNLRKVTSTVVGFNKRSLKYCKKCGYKVEGKRRNQFFKNGKYWDEIMLAVFKKDWLPLWRKFQKEE